MSLSKAFLQAATTDISKNMIIEIKTNIYSQK